MRARERSAIVGLRIEILPEAPMTPAIAGHVPTSAPYARDEPSVSEELRSKRPHISLPQLQPLPLLPPLPPLPPPPPPPLPLVMEMLHAGGSC